MHAAESGTQHSNTTTQHHLTVGNVANICTSCNAGTGANIVNFSTDANTCNNCTAGNNVTVASGSNGGNGGQQGALQMSAQQQHGLANVFYG